MDVTQETPIFIPGTSADTHVNTHRHEVGGLAAACCKSEVVMRSADLLLVLKGCLVSPEGSGEGLRVGWQLSMALLVDHSTRAHGDVSKN